MCESTFVSCADTRTSTVGAPCILMWAGGGRGMEKLARREEKGVSQLDNVPITFAHLRPGWGCCLNTVLASSSSRDS